jgi:hypothetical protein
VRSIHVQNIEPISLIAASRPITDAGARVPPPDLLNHRTNHDFRLPGCLCASNGNGFGFTESALYLAKVGKPYAGEYVAGCALDRCGYLGASCSYQ